MDEWVDKGVAPPKSNYPRVEDKSLVSLDEYRAAFPKIPGMKPPSVLNGLNVMNFGPGFNSKGGVMTVLPPVPGPAYTILVPRPDKDGVGVAGIKTIATRAPTRSARC